MKAFLLKNVPKGLLYILFFQIHFSVQSSKDIDQHHPINDILSKNCDNSRSFNILHFNDVYDVSLTPYFAYEYLKRNTPKTLRVFSGDVLSPSFLSTILKGHQFVNFFNTLKPHFSVIGNHELDFGENNFLDIKKVVDTTWLISNFKHKGKQKNIGAGQDSGKIFINGIKICVFGIVDQSWIDSLLINPQDYDYEDFLSKSRTLSKSLRSAGCEVVIALSHMATASDVELLKDPESDIDFILGGHQHVYLIQRFNERILLKSGENFAHFSDLKVSFSKTALNQQSQNSETDTNFNFKLDLTPTELLREKSQTFSFSLKRNSNLFLNVWIEKIPVNTRNGNQNLKLFYYNKRNFSKYFDQASSPILKFDTDVDVRSDQVSRVETPIGHFLSDLFRAYFGTDLAVLATGTVRSETIFYAGTILKEYDAITMFSLPLNLKLTQLPAPNMKMLFEFTLQNNLSEEDIYEISGLKYHYNPSKPLYNFIDLSTLFVGKNQFSFSSSYTLLLPEITDAMKQSSPLLAAIPTFDPPTGQITMLDVLKNFWLIPSIPENRDEFAIFQTYYRNLSMEDINVSLQDNTPKVNDRLNAELVNLVGISNALKTLKPQAITRLRLYTLAAKIEQVNSKYIFVISPMMIPRRVLDV